MLAPLAVDAVRHIADSQDSNADLNMIRVVRKLGGTVDDTEMVEGLVFSQKASSSAGGPTSIKDAKIAVLQFQLSPPKTDIENSVIVSDYQQMDRILKEERNYIADLCKKIAKAFVHGWQVHDLDVFLRWPKYFTTTITRRAFKTAALCSEINTVT